MRSQQLAIKFSRELVQKMTDAANSKYISRSAFIREAVAEKLDRDRERTEAEVDHDEEEEFDWEKLLNDES